MPPIEIDGLYHKAVLWVKAGEDADNEPVFDSAVEIDCRWNNTQKEMTAADGTTILIDALVVVDRDIPVGSLLWEGELEDWLGTGSDDNATSTLMEVRTYAKRTKDIRSRYIRRTVGVSKYKDVIPELL